MDGLDYKYLDYNGLVKISEVLELFASEYPKKSWFSTVESYAKGRTAKKNNFEFIRKNNAYYGSFEVFCYYLDNNDIKDMPIKYEIKAKVQEEYINFLNKKLDDNNYRDGGKALDDIRTIYDFKTIDDLYEKIVKSFISVEFNSTIDGRVENSKRVPTKDDTFALLFKWMIPLMYMKKLNTFKTHITDIKTRIKKNPKIDNTVKKYIDDFFNLPSFVYTELNIKSVESAKKGAVDNSNLMKLNSKDVTDLINKLNRELQTDLKAFRIKYDINSVVPETIRDDLKTSRTLTKVTTKLSMILGLSTGRRLAELLVNAEFEVTSKKANEVLERVNFMGVAKKKNLNDKVEIFKIPIIGLNGVDIIFYSKVLKMLLPDSIRQLVKNGSDLKSISNRFQVYIKRNWKAYSNKTNIDDMRDCRGAYALYCNIIDNNSSMDSEYIQSILLHNSTTSASHYWSKFKMIK